MGAFHDGHRSLFAAARDECATVVASLFVNPAQFGPGEDFTAYPRDEARDAGVAEAAGIDVLFVPPPTRSTRPDSTPGSTRAHWATVLEGAARPGHFRGVATVCLKLFHLAQPERAYFGRKDAQQVAVIRAMLRDLDLEPRHHAAGDAHRPRPGRPRPVVAQRVPLPGRAEQALALPRALDAGLAAHRSGGDPVEAARAVLDRGAGLEVDYVAVAAFDGPTLAAAVRVGHDPADRQRPAERRRCRWRWTDR